MSLGMPKGAKSLRDYLIGWRCGAASQPIPAGQSSADCTDWLKGWADGRTAFQAVAEKKRKALKLPPEAIATAMRTTS